MQVNYAYVKVLSGNTGQATEPDKQGVSLTSETSNSGQPVRFYDSREKYLLFVTTTDEKWAIAQRINEELDKLKPKPPALRLFDAGMGDASVISHVLRAMHDRFPEIPFLAAAKEISMEDVRLGLEKMADRFAEHPQMVLVITNMRYAEAAQLYPKNPDEQTNLKRWDIALKGTTAKHFDSQLRDLTDIVRDGWQTRPSPKTGNPLYVNPSMIVLYREDQKFALDAVIPDQKPLDTGFDMIMCAQPYRSRTPAEKKVKTVLAPMASSLSVNGRMIVVQSTGYDPGMEIVRSIWPSEIPFPTPRHDIIEALRQEMGEAFQFCVTAEENALFKYRLHSLPEEISNIGTSALLAAWNAAVYVAQMSDEETDKAMLDNSYIDATREVVNRHGGLWFLNESFVVVHEPDEGC